jgi:hypothetical protein
MQFLALYTADSMGPPDAEHMKKMGALIDKQKKAGKLVSTGGLKLRAKDGLRIRQKNGAATVEDGGAAWTGATGWALLQANTREELVSDVKEFLAVAGDGVSEVIEISEAPPEMKS